MIEMYTLVPWSVSLKPGCVLMHKRRLVEEIYWKDQRKVTLYQSRIGTMAPRIRCRHRGQLFIDGVRVMLAMPAAELAVVAARFKAVYRELHPFSVKLLTGTAKRAAPKRGMS